MSVGFVSVGYRDADFVGFVNRWALAPGPNSLANSLNTKPEDSDKGFKVSAIGLSPVGSRNRSVNTI